MRIQNKLVKTAAALALGGALALGVTSGTLLSLLTQALIY
ncbi:MAG: hypothetical protein RL302_137, partial [Pseudomonadota bacterium]